MSQQVNLDVLKNHPIQSTIIGGVLLVLVAGFFSYRAHSRAHRALEDEVHRIFTARHPDDGGIMDVEVTNAPSFVSLVFSSGPLQATVEADGVSNSKEYVCDLVRGPDKRRRVRKRNGRYRTERSKGDWKASCRDGSKPAELASP